MRVGSTLLLRNKYCFQSYNWDLLRPLGDLQLAVDSLEEYGCDEVAIIRPVREFDCIKEYESDLSLIRSLNSMTPISFGGGIRSIDNLKLISDLPIERLILSSSFIEKNRKLITKARNTFGRQAIQCLLPIKTNGNKFLVFLSNQNKFIPLENMDLNFIDEMANEVIFLDVDNEGKIDKFNKVLIKERLFKNSKIILSGGIGREVTNWARQNSFASVLIENRVLHKEYSIAKY